MHTNYLLANGRQPVETVTGRFEANDTLPGAAETGVAHTHRDAPRGQRGVTLVAGAPCWGHAARRSQRAAARLLQRRHDQRHVGAAVHAARAGVDAAAAAAPALSPEPPVLRRFQVLTFEHGTLVRWRALQEWYRYVLHRCCASYFFSLLKVPLGVAPGQPAIFSLIVQIFNSYICKS